MTDQDACTEALSVINADATKRAEEIIRSVQIQVGESLRKNGKETVLKSLSKFGLLQDIAGRFAEAYPNTPKDDAATLTAVARKLFTKC